MVSRCNSQIEPNNWPEVFSFHEKSLSTTPYLRPTPSPGHCLRCKEGGAYSETKSEQTLIWFWELWIFLDITIFFSTNTFTKLFLKKKNKTIGHEWLEISWGWVSYASRGIIHTWLVLLTIPHPRAHITVRYFRVCDLFAAVLLQISDLVSQ